MILQSDLSGPYGATHIDINMDIDYLKIKQKSLVIKIVYLKSIMMSVGVKFAPPDYKRRSISGPRAEGVPTNNQR